MPRKPTGRSSGARGHRRLLLPARAHRPSLLQVPARLAYGILLANVLMYMLGLLTGLLRGPKAAEHFFLSFCQINERIMTGEYYRCASAPPAAPPPAHRRAPVCLLLGLVWLWGAVFQARCHVPAGRRLASSSFLHDSFAHLCTSSYALWTIAPQVESALGSGTFLSIYYLSGLAGNVLSFEYGDAITVGASSATFGLIGAAA